MELNQYFLGLVLSMTVLHLATVAADHLRTLWDKRSFAKPRREAVNQERDDWYVFFHCSDLLGKEPRKATPAPSKTEQVVNQTANERQDKPRISRPRARL